MGFKMFIMCFILAATVAGNHPVLSAEDHYHCYPRPILSHNSLECAAIKFKDTYKLRFVSRGDCLRDYYYKIRLHEVQVWTISYCNLHATTARMNPEIFSYAALKIDAGCTAPGGINKGGYYVNRDASVHFVPSKISLKEVIKQAGKKTLKYGKSILKPNGAC